MRYRMLGASGCSVSALCLGTMTFGDATAEDVAFAQLDAFVEVGGTLVDTADVYALGASEAIIGRWMKSRGPDVSGRVVLATKGRFQTAKEPNGIGLSRRHLDIALNSSLRRLGVDTIDLYQLHGWDPLTPLEESLRFMDDAVTAGKIRYVGLSNFTGWQLQKAIDLAACRGWAPPVTLQPQYSLLVRQPEWELIAACEYNGIGVMPWSPLAGGVLTGKYSRGGAPMVDSRLSASRLRVMYGPRTQEERTWRVLDALRTVADRQQASPAQIALAWVAGRPTVSSVVLGARTVEQLLDNLGAADMHLSLEDRDLLDQVSEPDRDYPYDEIGLWHRSRRPDGHFVRMGEEGPLGAAPQVG